LSTPVVATGYVRSCSPPPLPSTSLCHLFTPLVFLASPAAVYVRHLFMTLPHHPHIRSFISTEGVHFAFHSEEHAPKRKLEEDKLDDILEQLKAIREDKKTTISISRITQKHLTALLKELGLSRRTVEFDMASTTKRVSSFVWMDKKEDAHAQEYLTWLEGCINLPSG
ncbi:hypothetical protein BC938DRAFT_471398, partial [Jimgerdemannia flammicorona]